MLAVHLEHGAVTARETALPRRPEGYALLRLLAAGICNTDLELQRGYYGFEGIPGHEFVGEVVEADARALVGKRVVGEINLACRDCDWCRRGLGRHCPHRTVLGIVKHPGAFAEYLTLPERNLHVLAGRDAAGASGIRRAAGRGVRDPGPGVDSVQRGGGGAGGWQAGAVDRDGAAGPGLPGASVRPARRETANCREGGGGHGNRSAAPPAAYNWVVDATGSPEGLREAVAMTRPRGTLILKSTVHGVVGVDTAPIIVNEITLVGSRCGRFEAALPLLEHGLIPVEDLIACRFPLREAARAFERAGSRGTLKVLLESQ